MIARELLVVIGRDAGPGHRATRPSWAAL